MIKQIVSVIVKDYLKKLHNEGTDTIIIFISQLLKHLVTDYGMVYWDVLDQEEAKIKALFWNLSDPTVQIYNVI